MSVVAGQGVASTESGYAVEMTRDEHGFFARIPDLPGCESNGDTLDEAYASIEEAKAEWIQVVLGSGGTVPPPRAADDYSGKFVVRVGASIHRDLVRLAALDGVSLNTFVLSVLARETGRQESARPVTSSYHPEANTR